MRYKLLSFKIDRFRVTYVLVMNGDRGNKKDCHFDDDFFYFDYLPMHGNERRDQNENFGCKIKHGNERMKEQNGAPS